MKSSLGLAVVSNKTHLHSVHFFFWWSREVRGGWSFLEMRDRACNLKYLELELKNNYQYSIQQKQINHNKFHTRTRKAFP